MKKFVMTVAAAAIAATTMVSAANAGGLFGDGGFIRGWVGKVLDPVENKVLTPAARGATVAAGAAVGAAVGGNAGAAVGAAIGEGINRAAAGQKVLP